MARNQSGIVFWGVTLLVSGLAILLGLILTTGKTLLHTLGINSRSVSQPITLNRALVTPTIPPGYPTPLPSNPLSDKPECQIQGTAGCPYPEPLQSHVTIHGRFIDDFTKQPVTDVHLFPIANAQFSHSTDSDKNGKFTLETRLSHLTLTDPARAEVTLGYNPECYFFNQGIIISLQIDGSLMVNLDQLDLTSYPIRFPVTQESMDIGDIPLWPATKVTYLSDIPVQMNLVIPEGRHSFGSLHYLTCTDSTQYELPYRYQVKAVFVDQSKKTYTSPLYVRQFDRLCSTPTTVRLRNGLFSWQ